MTAPQVQVLLVSAQAAPNLLPAIDPALKPKHAVLVVSQKMQRQAGALQKVLTESGIKVTQAQLVDEHRIDQIESVLMNIAAEHEGVDIALNLTGGTKLMALAAQTVASVASWRSFYVDVDTDEVIWIGRHAPASFQLTSQLRLSHYLRAYGFSLENGVDRPAPEARHTEALETLVMQVGSLAQPLSQLNYLAQIAEDKKSLIVEIGRDRNTQGSLPQLLTVFEKAGCLQVQGEHIRFRNELERDFVKGGWLEHHVFRRVTALHGSLELRDKAANLTVTDGTGVKNEMDIAFLARNRLWVIECKTARMDSPTHAKANDTLFKLAEVCRRVGGIGTRGMLVSYRPVRESEKKLATALNIEVVCGAEIQRLQERITRWVRN